MTVEDEDRKYELPMSGIRLQGLLIARFEKDSVLADFALDDLTDVQLRIERRGGDWFLIVFCLLLAGAAAAAIVFWSIPAGTQGAWFGGGVARGPARGAEAQGLGRKEVGRVAAAIASCDRDQLDPALRRSAPGHLRGLEAGAKCLEKPAVGLAGSSSATGGPRWGDHARAPRQAMSELGSRPPLCASSLRGSEVRSG